MDLSLKGFRHLYNIKFASTFCRVLHTIPSNEAIDTVEVSLSVIVLKVIIILFNLVAQTRPQSYVPILCGYYIISCHAYSHTWTLYYVKQVLQPRANPMFVSWKGGAVSKAPSTFLAYSCMHLLQSVDRWEEVQLYALCWVFVSDDIHQHVFCGLHFS